MTSFTARRDQVTAALGLSMLVGAGLDGWAHANAKPDSFFTPWHAVLYAGFLATAAWIAVVVAREGVVRGYGWSLVGLGLFFAGGLGDLIWHSVFGVEVGIEAPMSPTHLVLLVGAILILTTPVRASHGPTAVVIAVASVTALVSLALSYVSPFAFLDATRGHAPAYETLGLRAGIASFLVSTVVLFGPALLLVRRNVPAGTFTGLIGGSSALVVAANVPGLRWLFLAALGGGVAVDILNAVVRPARERVARMRVFAAAAPASFWSVYLIVVGSAYGVAWEPELWAGAVAWCALLGVGLSFLVVPPAGLRDAP